MRHILSLAILSSWIGSDTAAVNTISGTSVATAHVSGLFVCPGDRYYRFLSHSISHSDPHSTQDDTFCAGHSRRPHRDATQDPQLADIQQCRQLVTVGGCVFVMDSFM